ncbi:MAG TPA: response regulator, partial [Methanofastidiosum sp.]|nr:response regulator [Methanofastidiosum sp.]
MEKNEFNILIIDDEEGIRESLQMILENEGYKVFTADSGESGIKEFEKNKIDLVLLDLKMKRISGEETLKKIKDINNDTMVIIVTGHATLDSSLEAIKYGAYDYLRKPTSVDEIRRIVFKAYDRWKLSSLVKHYNVELRQRYIKRNKELISVITLSERLREIDSLERGAKLVVDTINEAAGFDKVVFFLGGNGTPKIIHNTGFDLENLKQLEDIYTSSVKYNK